VTAARRALLWFGVLGAPAAWVFHLVAGYGIQEADCSRGSARWGFSSHPLEIAVTAAALAIGLGALLASAWIWRTAETRGADPRGRVAFMAFAGIISSMLFLGIIAVGGAGAAYLDPCAPG
jgi:hypothetical protein